MKYHLYRYIATFRILVGSASVIRSILLCIERQILCGLFNFNHVLMDDI